MSETNEKVHMLNVLWFKPDGGAEKYAEYGAAAAPIVARYGGEMIDSIFLSWQWSENGTPTSFSSWNGQIGMHS